MFDVVINFISALTVTLNIVLGAFVFLKGYKKIINVVYFFFSVAISGWVLTNWFTYLFTDYDLIVLNGKLTFAFASLIVPLLLTFEKYFPSKNQITRGILMNSVLAVAWVAGLIFAYISLFTTGIMLSPLIVAPHIVTLNQGPVHKYFFLFYILFVGWAFLLHIHKLSVAKGIIKQKLKVVLLGFAITAFFGILGNLILVTFFSNPFWQAQVSHIGSLFTVAIVCSMAYAILRYRLMDISIVIRKSAVQLLTFILLFAIYAYALLLVQRGSSPAVSLSSNTSLLITIFIIAITIEPLRKFIYKWIDGLFANKERMRQESLQRLQMVSASTTQFQSLLTRTEDELSKAIGQKPAFLMVNRQRQEIMAQDGETSLGQLDSAIMQKILTGKILIADELSYRIENGETSLQPVQAWFGKHQFAAVVPLGSGEECIGLFAFPKRGSAIFTTDIVHFLKSFQDQLQFAFANALAYKQAIERITALKH